MCKKLVKPYTKDACLDHEHVDGYEDMPAAEKRLYNDGILCNSCNLIQWAYDTLSGAGKSDAWIVNYLTVVGKW